MHNDTKPKEQKNQPRLQLCEGWDYRPRVKKDVDKDLNIKSLDRQNRPKKNFAYYQNDYNIWNNTTRTCKKIYSHYYETWDKNEAELQKN